MASSHYMGRNRSGTALLLGKVRLNGPGRIDEDLDGNAIEESLKALTHRFEMNDPQIDVACRVRITSQNRSRGNDSHRCERSQHKRDRASQRLVIRCR